MTNKYPDRGDDWSYWPAVHDARENGDLDMLSWEEYLVFAQIGLACRASTGICRRVTLDELAEVTKRNLAAAERAVERLMQLDLVACVTVQLDDGERDVRFRIVTTIPEDSEIAPEDRPW